MVEGSTIAAAVSVIGSIVKAGAAGKVLLAPGGWDETHPKTLGELLGVGKELMAVKSGATPIADAHVHYHLLVAAAFGAHDSRVRAFRTRRRLHRLLDRYRWHQSK